MPGWVWRNRRRGRGNVLDDLISQPVLWCLVALYIPAGAVILGLNLRAPASCPPTGAGADADADVEWYLDSSLLSLMWQTILQVLASYCSLVPELRDRRKRIKASMRRSKVVEDSVFYGAVAVSVVAAVLAPVLYKYKGLRCPANVTVSSAMNFLSTISALIAASQLAGRIE